MFKENRAQQGKDLSKLQGSKNLAPMIELDRWSHGWPLAMLWRGSGIQVPYKLQSLPGKPRPSWRPFYNGSNNASLIWEYQVDSSRWPFDPAPRFWLYHSSMRLIVNLCSWTILMFGIIQAASESTFVQKGIIQFRLHDLLVSMTCVGLYASAYVYGFVHDWSRVLLLPLLITAVMGYVSFCNNIRKRLSLCDGCTAASC